MDVSVPIVNDLSSKLSSPMASHVEISRTRFDLFERTRANLSDAVIGPVLLTKRVRDDVFSTGKVLGRKRSSPKLPTFSLPEEKETLKADVRPRASKIAEDKAQLKVARRREQIRASQARYREKQRNVEQGALTSIQAIQEDIEGLKLKRQRLRFQSKSNNTSPWNSVSEVFRLIETSFQSPWSLTNVEEMKNKAETQRSTAFLREALAPDVTMGDLHGFGALLEQLRRYSLYFGQPRLELKKIESMVSGVMRATAALSVTITEFTLQSIFPHASKSKNREGNIELDPLGERLLGQRLRCSCSMNFLFEEESGLIKRLEIDVDLMRPLIRVLGNVEDASLLFENALITPGGAIGDLATRRQT